MSFNLVLDEPTETDQTETHEDLNFIVENKLFDEFGPFSLSSIKYGPQVYLQLTASKQAEQVGGCDSCSSCG